MLALFFRLTLAIAAVLIAVMLLTALVKIAVIAVTLAACLFGGLFVFNFVRALFRRTQAVAPVTTTTRSY